MSEKETFCLKCSNNRAILSHSLRTSITDAHFLNTKLMNKKMCLRLTSWICRLAELEISLCLHLGTQIHWSSHTPRKATDFCGKVLVQPDDQEGLSLLVGYLPGSPDTQHLVHTSITRSPAT